MIYPVRKLIEADFTVSAINAKIAELNTLYTLTVPNVVQVVDGAVTVIGGLPKAGFPLVAIYVGTQPTNGEMASFGKRDIPDFPVIFAYHTRTESLANARRDAEVTLEALMPILEGLTGKAFGATLRQIVEVASPSMSVEVFESSDSAPVRLGGVLRTSLVTRTQGV